MHFHRLLRCPCISFWCVLPQCGGREAGVTGWAAAPETSLTHPAQVTRVSLKASAHILQSLETFASDFKAVKHFYFGQNHCKHIDN